MDEIAPQTENISTFKTSTRKRTVIDEKLHGDDSNSDEEYATSGFYVREKSNDKTIDSSNAQNKSEPEESQKQQKENGVSSDESSHAPIENGHKTPNNANNKKINKPAPNPNKNKPKNDDEWVIEKGNKSDNNVTSSNSEVEDNAAISSSGDEEENGVSSTSINVENEKVSSPSNTEKEQNKSGDEVENVNKTEEERDDKSEDNSAKKKSNNEDTKEAEEKSSENEGDNEDIMEIEVPKENNSGKDVEEATDKDKPTKEPDLDDEVKIIETKDDDDDVKIIDVDTDSKEKGAKSKKVNNVTDNSQPGSSGLQKHKSDSAESQDVELMDEEDQDFDPSMFCPDITMDVDDAPVVPEEPRDGAGSPLPYEQAFSTLVDEVTGAELQFDLTPVEIEMRKQMFTVDNPVEKTKVHCTACNVHLGSALSGANNRFVHPLLKVLICKNCYHFYTSGEFQKDEDGSELYCRWCGQGGHVLCCSSCEYVFCKRCIRNNFGIKKFKEIRESDDWNCFRCDPDQLSILRAACAEFMEYYTRELARASSLAESHPEVMTTDYTTCCSSPELKKEEAKTPVSTGRSRRKRTDYDQDPDYTPVKDDEQPPLKKIAPGPSPLSSVNKTSPVPSLRPLIPKPIVRPINMGVPRPQISAQPGQVFRLAQPTNARFPTPTYTLQKTATQGNTVRNPTFITVPSSKVSNPGFIQIVPTGTRTVQQRPMGTISTTNITRPATSAAPVRAKQLPTQRDPQMKHEWFEKTVRAAARVNSNLSYTLTQLNRQQSQAGSVEALAMVHNKLQEVLSTSINSLIQIRKNLRTEFISGIKNIKFPAKTAPAPPSLAPKPVAAKDDDDVIFVNTTKTGPVTNTQPPPLIISKSVSLTKIKNSVTNPFANPKPSTSGAKPASIATKIVSPNKPSVATVSSSTPVKGGGFLKVRSFVSLQTVPSECITIPDDPTSPTNEREDPLKIPDDPLGINNADEREAESEKPQPSEDKQEISSNSSTLTANSPAVPADEPLIYIVTENPTPEIKKMMHATVEIHKSTEIEELLMMNGDKNLVEEEEL